MVAEGTACPRDLYLCAGQRVLVHKSLDKLLWPDVSQAFLRGEGEEESETGSYGGLVQCSCGLLPPGPPPEGLWAPARLTGALQPCSGLSQISGPSLLSHVQGLPQYMGSGEEGAEVGGGEQCPHRKCLGGDTQEMGLEIGKLMTHSHQERPGG